MLRNWKLSFEASDLSKHPIKNLQSTINIILDKGDEGEEADNHLDSSTQNLSSSSQTFSEIPDNKDKGKEKDTKGQQRNRHENISSKGRKSDRGDNDSSSDEKPDKRNM